MMYLVKIGTRGGLSKVSSPTGDIPYDVLMGLGYVPGRDRKADWNLQRMGIRYADIPLWLYYRGKGAGLSLNELATYLLGNREIVYGNAILAYASDYMPDGCAGSELQSLNLINSLKVLKNQIK